VPFTPMADESLGSAAMMIGAFLDRQWAQGVSEAPALDWRCAVGI